MNFKKLILPMLAFICAIGVAFATVDLKPEPKKVANDYIEINGSRQAIDEQECLGEGFSCRVKFSENGPEYEVFDEMDDLEPKDSASEEATLINP